MISRHEPRALLAHAMQLQRAGRLAEAEALYAETLRQWPEFPDAWYELAVLQRHAGRFEAALISYQQALDRGVSQPEEVHLNRGVIYSDYLRQDAAAERELNAALALNASYVPAMLNLANLREDYGRNAEALALYERILQLQPNYNEALARYAALKRVTDPDDALIRRVRAAISHPSTPPQDRASLGFALGKRLDDCSAYDEAFKAYAEANRNSRLCAGTTQPLYDRKQQELFVDELIVTFSRDRAAVRAAASARPIFICGMFRSGSTLTEQVLAAHPQVIAGGELPFLPALVSNELSPFPARAQGLNTDSLAMLAARYLEQVHRVFPMQPHVTDKRPDNFLYIGLIKQLFPNARIIHTRRHALDNCLSIFFLHLDHRMAYALDLMDTAHYYAQYRRLMRHWDELYGTDVLDFDYDIFVRDPRAAIERLLAYCGLPWAEECLSFQNVNNAVKTASVSQVREPLYQRASGRWRNYAAQLTPVRDYLVTTCPELKD